METRSIHNLEAQVKQCEPYYDAEAHATHVLQLPTPVGPGRYIMGSVQWIAALQHTKCSNFAPSGKFQVGVARYSLQKQYLQHRFPISMPNACFWTLHWASCIGDNLLDGREHRRAFGHTMPSTPVPTTSTLSLWLNTDGHLGIRCPQPRFHQLQL